MASQYVTPWQPDQLVAPGENMADAVYDPSYGWLGLTTKGGVYQEETGPGQTQIGSGMYGGSYLGYLNTLQQTNPSQYAVESQSPMQFSGSGLSIGANGAYTLTSTGGQTYNFNGVAGAQATTNVSNAFQSNQQSAYDQIQSVLSGYGFTGSQLSQLMSWATNIIQNNGSATSSDLSAIVQSELPNQTAFQQRFPAIAARQKAGLPAITVTDYLNLESAYAQAEQAAGIPPNWASYDNLIANNVSSQEYSDRLTQGYDVVAQGSPETLQAFQDYYGITPSQLAAYFTNPAKAEPLLIQQALASQIGGSAIQSGFGAQQAAGKGLSQAEALQLAQQGTTYSQAQQGFSQIAQEKQVLGALPGQQQPALTNDQVLGATFGSNGAAAQQIKQNEQLQKNYFAQGTNVTQTQTGLQGIGQIQR